MKSLFLRRSTLVKSSVRSRRPLFCSSTVSHYLGRDSRSTRSIKRNSSSFPSVPPTNHVDTPPQPPSQLSVETLEENETAEKPKKRLRALPPKESSQLPSNLDILWTPEYEDNRTESWLSVSLPPPELFEELLDNLQVTLHPQTQHRATYSSEAGPPVEPTYALYCPIEGGQYIIDETVHELARKTGSDVVVLDAVQLAAGECGQFGKAASVLELPENPLHLPASSQASQTDLSHRSDSSEDDGNSYDEPSFFRVNPAYMTVHLLPSSLRSSASNYLSADITSPSKSKAFFDEIVNIARPPKSGDSSIPSRKPRLIYIRDYATLAASSSTWYPPLVAAVRQRRAGPIARSSSPIPNPMTIIFGVTPPIMPFSSSDHSSSSGPPQGLVNLLMNRQAIAISPPGVRTGKPEWDEDDSSNKAREHRLRDRLKKWEKGDAHLLEELPGLTTASEEYPKSLSVVRKPSGETVMLGTNPTSSPLHALLGPILDKHMSSSGKSESGASFFRSSVVFPSSRSIDDERSCRMARRREINELTMRMAINSIGGHLLPWDHSPSAPSSQEVGKESSPSEERNDNAEMLGEWSTSVTVWPLVQQIADRAVGFVADHNMRNAPAKQKLSLDPTPIPWSAVIRAWAAHKHVRVMRKTLLSEALSKIPRNEERDPKDGVDRVIEVIKQDPSLDQHEHRLLSCVVDPRTLISTFQQVHLPPHTIDSVRTIVSLPLLHPMAFQHGILKEHGITGCLLFGPPGTGKTLVVRALAKEAECRMLAIAPSDVMDMYVGEGEKLVKAVFSLARRLSPCVVFIDEIDSLFGARMSSHETGGAFAHRGVITEFMSEMDGLRSSREDRVIVIGATNRPFDLDDAVLRRLPRRLLVDLPGENERREILKILLRDETLGSDVDLDVLAKKTDSFSGSDLKHLCVSAALDAVKGHISLPWIVQQVNLAPNTSTKASSVDLLEAVPHNVPSQELEAAAAPVGLSPMIPESHTAPATDADSQTGEAKDDSELKTDAEPPSRVLSLANFIKALKEITPSSSESLGTLGELRKWNDEFGEGRKDKRRQIWGKGNFGFVDKDSDKLGELKIGAESSSRIADGSDL